MNDRLSAEEIIIAERGVRHLDKMGDSYPNFVGEGLVVSRADDGVSYDIYRYAETIGPDEVRKIRESRPRDGLYWGTATIQ